MVVGLHPTNEMLRSDLLPRWMLIGWLLGLPALLPPTQGGLVAPDEPTLRARWAVLLDFFGFGEDENVMLVEPALLLCTRCAQDRHVTAPPLHPLRAGRPCSRHVAAMSPPCRRHVTAM